MDYYGLFPKFRLQRPLNEREIEHQLHQHIRNDIPEEQLDSDRKVIVINSHYLELVDKFYYSKGLLSFVSSLCSTTFGSALFFILYYCIFVADYSTEMLFFLLFVIPLLSGFICFALYTLKKEWFAWTHYPIRFDRKNRLVYAYRIDGSIITAKWDDIFFTSGLFYKKSMKDEYYISGHILDKDKSTIIDTFCLPATSFSKTELLTHWEFVRRYMEDGPQDIIQHINFCLPIKHRKEHLWFSFFYLLTNLGGRSILFLPVSLPLTVILGIPRCIAVLTSRRPVWPENIQKKSTEDTKDPYFFDVSKNPKYLLIYWFCNKK